MAILAQSTTYTRDFLMVLSSDHLSPATGKTVTVNLSKAGGTFAAAGGTVTEVANGHYKIALTTTDTNTFGDLAFNCTAGSCDATDFVDQVGPAPVNVVQWLGIAPTAATGGVPDVNVKNVNNVAAATDGQGLMKVDVEDWHGLAVPAANVSGIPIIDVGYYKGHAVATENINGTIPVDVIDWKGTGPNQLISGKLDAVTSLRNGTAQAGAAGTITLDSGASATNNFYNDGLVFLLSGTGAGQARSILSYVGSTKVATIYPNWVTNPDSSSTFVIIPEGQVDVGAWLSIVLPAQDVGGLPDVNVKSWRGLTPNNLISGRVDTSVGAIAAGQYTVKRNTALTFSFAMFDSTNHQLATGKTVTVKYTIDGGAQATTSNSVVEISGGEYKIALLAAETNGVQISLTMTAAGCDDQAVTFFTQV